MLSRRELIAGGGAMHMAGGDRAAAQREADLGQVREELRGIRDALARNSVTTPTVGELRNRQRQFYKVNQHFPQYIDVGIGVWERMQDWHIAHQRALNIQAAGDGRFMMEFIMSILVLKYELGENDIGQAYDRQ
jgi:hypothetical protein